MNPSNIIRSPFAYIAAVLFSYVMTSPAFAATGVNFGAAKVDAGKTGIAQTLDTVMSILNYVSIGVVTIAFIFAGYQIAFANKRVSDVAPVVIGGVVIGAAGQFANILLSSGATS